jgi:hypothetical protein
MYNREVIKVIGEDVLEIGISTSESFNFKSGMSGCLNALSYLKVNGVHTDVSDIFEFMTIDGLSELICDV